jgi:hypothetical protein
MVAAIKFEAANAESRTLNLKRDLADLGSREFK